MNRPPCHSLSHQCPSCISNSNLLSKANLSSFFLPWGFKSQPCHLLAVWPHCCCSVTKLCRILCDPMQSSTPDSCLPLSPVVCSNACPLSQWCCLIISFSAAPLSFCLQSFPASGFFPVSQFFASGGQSTGASASVLPMNIQDWFLLGLIGLISLQSKGLSGVFSNTTVWRNQFFGAQPSLWSNTHICTWLLGKP